MTGIVSFSIFGDDKDRIYRHGALINAEMYGRHRADTICRFYVGLSALKWATEFLAPLPNVQVMDYSDRPENQIATLWRYDALLDTEYDFYLFRDTDSRPIARERAAVDEWLASDCAFHIMRDHPYHCVPMMAGLWGVKGPKAPLLNKFFQIRHSRAFYQVDQMFLKATVWRWARTDVMSHVDCDHKFNLPFRPFPLPLTDEGFCGEGFYGDGRPRFPEHSRSLVG